MDLLEKKRNTFSRRTWIVRAHNLNPPSPRHTGADAQWDYQIRKPAWGIRGTLGIRYRERNPQELVPSSITTTKRFDGLEVLPTPIYAHCFAAAYTNQVLINTIFLYGGTCGMNTMHGHTDIIWEDLIERLVDCYTLTQSRLWLDISEIVQYNFRDVHMHELGGKKAPCRNWPRL